MTVCSGVVNGTATSQTHTWQQEARKGRQNRRSGELSDTTTELKPHGSPILFVVALEQLAARSLGTDDALRRAEMPSQICRSETLFLLMYWLNLASLRALCLSYSCSCSWSCSRDLFDGGLRTWNSRNPRV